MAKQLPSSYWNLLKLTEELLHICERHNIIIWPECGSLLGYHRHSGIIPWDYDGDYGLFATDRNKFIELFNKEKSQNTILDVNYYKDDGCLIIHFNDNLDDTIDIVFYNQTQTGIDSIQKAETKQAYSCSYPYYMSNDEFHPLKESVFIGHKIYIPNKSEKILETTYGNWKECPKEFQDFVSDNFVVSPFKFITTHTINDFNELRNLIEKSDVPLIVKNSSLLNCSQSQFQKLIEEQKSPIWGYYTSSTWNTDDYFGKQIWKDYTNNSLKVNIVDSPVDDRSMLPDEWTKYIMPKLGAKSHYALTWILTNMPKVTHFHTDPEYAGGFMKLLEGEKIWWCIAPNDYAYLKSKGHSVDTLAELNIYDILRIENNYMFGKLYVGKINENDIIWFPINCMHKVITTKHSFGFGGYL